MSKSPLSIKECQMSLKSTSLRKGVQTKDILHTSPTHNRSYIPPINGSIDCLRYDLHRHDKDNDMQWDEKKRKIMIRQSI